MIVCNAAENESREDQPRRQSSVGGAEVVNSGHCCWVGIPGGHPIRVQSMGSSVRIGATPALTDRSDRLDPSLPSVGSIGSPVECWPRLREPFGGGISESPHRTRLVGGESIASVDQHIGAVCAECGQSTHFVDLSLGE